MFQFMSDNTTVEEIGVLLYNQHLLDENDVRTVSNENVHDERSSPLQFQIGGQPITCSRGVQASPHGVTPPTNPFFYDPSRGPAADLNGPSDWNHHVHHATNVMQQQHTTFPPFGSKAHKSSAVELHPPLDIPSQMGVITPSAPPLYPARGSGYNSPIFVFPMQGSGNSSPMYQSYSPHGSWNGSPVFATTPPQETPYQMTPPQGTPSQVTPTPTHDSPPPYAEEAPTPHTESERKTSLCASGRQCSKCGKVLQQNQLTRSQPQQSRRISSSEIHHAQTMPQIKSDNPFHSSNRQSKNKSLRMKVINLLAPMTKAYNHMEEYLQENRD